MGTGSFDLEKVLSTLDETGWWVFLKHNRLDCPVVINSCRENHPFGERRWTMMNHLKTVCCESPPSSRCQSMLECQALDETPHFLVSLFWNSSFGVKSSRKSPSNHQRFHQKSGLLNLGTPKKSQGPCTPCSHHHCPNYWVALMIEAQNSLDQCATQNPRTRKSWLSSHFQYSLQISDGFSKPGRHPFPVLPNLAHVTCAPGTAGASWLVVEPTRLKNDGACQFWWWHSHSFWENARKLPKHQPENWFEVNKTLILAQKNTVYFPWV